MKYSTRLSDAVHILVLISENKDGTLSSSDIATSVYTNPSYVRQLMSRLRNSGIISSVRGLATPTLIKEASHITLLDIYSAVEPELFVIECMNPKKSCIRNLDAEGCRVHRELHRIQDVLMRELSSRTIGEIMEQ